jgi:hypothetical protein
MKKTKLLLTALLLATSSLFGTTYRITLDNSSGTFDTGGYLNWTLIAADFAPPLVLADVTKLQQPGAVRSSENITGDYLVLPDGFQLGNQSAYNALETIYDAIGTSLSFDVVLSGPGVGSPTLVGTTFAFIIEDSTSSVFDFISLDVLGDGTLLPGVNTDFLSITALPMNTIPEPSTYAAAGLLLASFFIARRR